DNRTRMRKKGAQHTVVSNRMSRHKRPVKRLVFDIDIKMKNARYLRVLLILVGIIPLQSCGTYPGDGEIDPAAGLQRSDYINLRFRKTAEQQPEALPTPPPIPDMHVDTTTTPTVPG